MFMDESGIERKIYGEMKFLGTVSKCRKKFGLLKENENDVFLVSYINQTYNKTHSGY